MGLNKNDPRNEIAETISRGELVPYQTGGSFNLGVIIRESPPMLVPLKGAVAHCQQTEKFAREKKGCKKTVKEVS